MDDFLQLGKQALASQPFSALVGAELTGFSPGWVEYRRRYVKARWDSFL